MMNLSHEGGFIERDANKEKGNSRLAVQREGVHYRHLNERGRELGVRKSETRKKAELGEWPKKKGQK